MGVCFNKDEEQTKQFIEKYFMFVDEARYYKIYKEKFAKPDIMTIPTSQNISMTDKKQKQLYERFVEIAFRKEPLTNEKKNTFIETLAKHVDNIIDNTPCNGEIRKDKQNVLRYVARNFIQLKDLGKDEKGVPLNQRTLPNDNLGDVKLTPFQLFQGWYFYITSI